MPTIRDVLISLASAAAGAGVAIESYEQLFSKMNKPKAVKYLASMGIGAGVGLVGNFVAQYIDDTIGQSIRNWKDSQLGGFSNWKTKTNAPPSSPNFNAVNDDYMIQY